ncbi:MAG: HemK2/MTQ2 family protein methyltransferase [Nanoarchaeota archaeon]
MTTSNTVYDVHDDTLLLYDALCDKLASLRDSFDKDKKLRLLDMGAGSGYLGFEAYKQGWVDVMLADKNPEAVDHMKMFVEEEDLPIDIFQSDLFDSIPRERTFDLIVFNTPYLPFDTDWDEHDMSIHGGRKGNEVTLAFLDRVASYLSPDGSILLLFSSLSTPGDILEKADELGFSCTEVASKSLFFERLFVYEFKRRGVVHAIG